ncbi:hypothetical protein NXA99_07210 [Citrobacter amalonaticus]|uniref:hypothetical protein n=1 Tax=Citrobacter amalonaticus TaxID=35703 RepID=UPI00215C8F2B|nr:hypothetical protein [Citrobacter amalonaticus]MCR9028321.1 hypothetical protein [Citrobacter amalonaticus]
MIRNFVDGDIVTSGEHFVHGKTATQQAIIRRLRLFLGEYFLDGTDGTPWFLRILGKNNPDVAEANIKERIINTKDVISLSRFEFDFSPRTRIISIYAQIIDINNEQFDFIFREEII